MAGTALSQPEVQILWQVQHVVTMPGQVQISWQAQHVVPTQGQVQISWQAQHVVPTQGQVQISWQQAQHFRKVKCRFRGRHSMFARPGVRLTDRWIEHRFGEGRSTFARSSTDFVAGAAYLPGSVTDR